MVLIPLLLPLPGCVVSNPEWIPPLGAETTGASDISGSASSDASAGGSTSTGDATGGATEDVISTGVDSSLTTASGTDVLDMPEELDGLEDYQRRRTILLHTYALELNNAEEPKVEDIPVRVLLNEDRADWEALVENELRFVWDDGETILPHEVELWDDNNEFALIWVTLPYIYAQATETFYLYYDKENPGPGPQEPPNWESFATVHHLNGDSVDSANGLDGGPWPPGLNTIGSPGGYGAQMFGGTSLTLAPNPEMSSSAGYVSLLFQTESQLEMSLFRASHWDGDQPLLGPGIVTVLMSPDGYIDALVGGEQEGFNGAYAAPNGDLGWHHLAVSWDHELEPSQQVRIWLDGKPGQWINIEAQIGGHHLGGLTQVGAALEDLFFVGSIDELRQSASPRTDLYVQAEAESVLHADNSEWLQYSDADEPLNP